MANDSPGNAEKVPEAEHPRSRIYAETLTNISIMRLKMLDKQSSGVFSKDALLAWVESLNDALPKGVRTIQNCTEWKKLDADPEYGPIPELGLMFKQDHYMRRAEIARTYVSDYGIYGVSLQDKEKGDVPTVTTLEELMKK